ncbi:hypothetical protein JCM9279_002348 [Rhodotorula babjevae]
MPRPVPATLPGIGPGPYRRPGDHPGPAAELVASRLHTIDLEIVPRERYDQLAPIFRNLGGMAVISRFVTFFLDHLVPPSVARRVVLQPTLLPGRPYYFAAGSGEGGPDDPLHIVLPAVCIPAHRSPHGWLARSDGRAAHEPGMELLAAPTAVHVPGGLDGGTWLARMWEAGRLGWHGPPTPFELVSASPHLQPAITDKLRAGAFLVTWRPIDLHLDQLSSCAAPPPRSTTYCVRIRHREADTTLESITHMHVTFDVPLAQLVRGACDEVGREDEARRLEPRARAASERPVVVQQRWGE